VVEDEEMNLEGEGVDEEGDDDEAEDAGDPVSGVGALQV
jgi:hypothetical protein